MSEIQQSSLYGAYMQRLHWHVDIVDGVQIFSKRFPFTGGMMKIHRPERLPDVSRLLPLFSRDNIRTVVVEPVHTQNTEQLAVWLKNVSTHVTVYKGSPFLPTKTIRIDLTKNPTELFNGFTEAKRRAVRRAEKLGVTVSDRGDIQTLIQVKKISAGLFGGITTTGLPQLWETFAPSHAATLIASHAQRPVAGVLLLFWEDVALYWIAGATKTGKRNFAPTLLVWKCLLHAQSHGAKIFDFIGAWDERIPERNKDWLGFTKFKEGFGGYSVFYPLIPQNK